MLELVIALATLTGLEIILGIDNIIFIAIVAGKLPADQQPKARRLGLAAALVTRLALLASISFVLRLTEPLFTLPDVPMFNFSEEARAVSVRDLILIVGGLFLIAKSVHEIHDKMDHTDEEPGRPAAKAAGFTGVIVNIAIMDIIFSLDSVITAVGMVDKNFMVGDFEVNRVLVMSAAVVVAVVVMLVFANVVSNFVARNPTIKILALSFLILIGVMLTAEGFEQHLPKGYIYFAMAFSVVVEMLNLRIRPKSPHASATAKKTSTGPAAK